MSAIGAFRPVSAAVYETDADPVVVTWGDIDGLVAAAPQAPAGRARLLLHPDRNDTLHEMVIALPKHSCDHPHINFKSGKSFLALSGQFAVMVCSDDGSQVDPIVLSADAQRWPGGRIARLRAPAWHTIIPLAGDTVFLETIAGPFTENRFATWFPDADQPGEREKWAQKLRDIAAAAVADA